MQEELKRYSNRIRAEGQVPLQARVGRRSEHRRGGGAVGYDWRGSQRICTRRSLDRYRGADAGDGAGRLDRGDRTNSRFRTTRS